MPQGSIEGLLRQLFAELRDDLAIVIVGAAFALVRAMGIVIETGETGLRFTFGRAGRTLDPGFHLLVPIVQRARKVPTRSRSMDLPGQRVATFEGLVYHADANLIFRIVDVRKAIVNVDDLVKGMLQMLGLGVQEVLRSTDRLSMQDPRRLDAVLERNLAARLEVWGVTVEHAGFPSITPSQETLRITQLAHRTQERARMLAHLEEDLGSRRLAIALIGSRTRPIGRARAIRARERARGRERRLRKALMMRGWMKVQIKQAGLRVRRGGGRKQVAAGDASRKKRAAGREAE